MNGSLLGCACPLQIRPADQPTLPWQILPHPALSHTKTAPHLLTIYRSMWSIWMFTIPSLRARECTQPEKVGGTGRAEAGQAAPAVCEQGLAASSLGVRHAPCC